MKISEVYDFLNTLAPYNTQLPWDNSGFMVGNVEREIDSILLCLDCTNDVIQQAVSKGIKLIVCHHPLIFRPVSNVSEDTPVYNAIKNDITVISAHTNLDIAQGGVNDALCDVLNIKNVKPIIAENVPIMRAGETECCSVKEFARFCSYTLGNSVKYVDSNGSVEKVAVCSGSGGEFVYDVVKYGFDTFVTGEAKHHEYLDAKRLGVNLIVAGHFATEQVVLASIRDKMLNVFPECSIETAYEKNPYETVV